MMERFCVFCGNKPVSKNREHVIPQWLIRLTGDVNRDVYLGIKWGSPDVAKRHFSFSSFAFPACEECNCEFSQLETRSRSIVELILSRSALDATQWDTILDWLDKVRIGLWLGMMYLNNNYWGIKPNFHIGRRVGAKDRALMIYQTDNDRAKGLTWGAVDTPLFGLMPSCFVLLINDFLFFNISTDFLLAERIGFPYPLRRAYRQEGGEVCSMAAGTNRLQMPLLDGDFKRGGTQLFQPIIPGRCLQGVQPQGTELYDTRYVRNNCLDFDAGKGSIFRRERKSMVSYPTVLSREWLPKRRFPAHMLFCEMALLACRMQDSLYMQRPSYEFLDAAEAHRLGAVADTFLADHRLLCKTLAGKVGLSY